MKKKNETTVFWSIIATFLAVGTGVIIASWFNIGILFSVIIGLAFSFGVYKLPDFFSENRRHSISLVCVCTVGAVITFVCLFGFAFIIQIQQLLILEKSQTQIIQCVLIVVYFLNALVVSRKIHQEEVKIGNDPTRSRPIH